VVFDKTGTLTQDAMVLDAVQVRAGLTEARALAMAAAVAQHSLHPASRALMQAYGVQSAGQQESWVSESIVEAAGQGVTGQVSLQSIGTQQSPVSIRLGSASFCGVPQEASDSLRVFLSDAQGWVATFSLMEHVRPQARRAVQALAQHGMVVHMLSGDSADSVARVAQLVGIDHAKGTCSPADKLAFLRSLQAGGHTVAMVGDGLNDGPVLAGAHVSFAFGQAVPLARSQSDFVVMGDSLDSVVQSVLLARKTMAIVHQNLWWALLYNAASIPLAIAGWMPAWLAGLGMATSSLIVVLNALRLARPAPQLGAQALLET
jgi:Cu2+-exporting ATPase